MQVLKAVDFQIFMVQGNYLIPNFNKILPQVLWDCVSIKSFRTNGSINYNEPILGFVSFNICRLSRCHQSLLVSCSSHLQWTVVSHDAAGDWNTLPLQGKQTKQCKKCFFISVRYAGTLQNVFFLKSIHILSHSKSIVLE